MRIELATLESGKGIFAHAYEPGALVLEDERVKLVEAPAISGAVRQKGNRGGRIRQYFHSVMCNHMARPIHFYREETLQQVRRINACRARTCLVTVWVKAASAASADEGGGSG